MTMDTAQILQQAVAHHQAGELPQAEALYRQILTADPRHADALHLLGLVAHQCGDHAQAQALIGQAIGISPAAAMYCNLGVVSQALGNIEQAIASFRQAIALQPQYAEAHYNLGSSYQAKGDLIQARSSYQGAIDIDPNNVAAHVNLGVVFHELGEPETAIACYQKALSLAPDHADAEYNLGNSYQKLDRLPEATQCYERAIRINPGQAEALYNLGVVLQSRGNPEQSIEKYQAAISIDPTSYKAFFNMATCFYGLGKLEQSIQKYREAIALKNDFEEAHYYLGNAYLALEQLEDASDCYLKVIAINPRHFEAINNLGLVFQMQGNLKQAMEYYNQSIAIKPDFAETYCNMGNLLQTQRMHDAAIRQYRHALTIKPDFHTAHSNLIFAMDMHSKMDVAALQLERKQWGALHAGTPLEYPPHQNLRDPDRRIRIGYISADFKQHSAPCVFGAMLMLFDRDRFEVFAYSNSRRNDPCTGLLQKNISCWRNVVTLSDDALAELIREDQIDILVDLSGHSAGNRLLAFAGKPAPIQITAWGYIGGTGMKAMDVLFADPILIPPEEKHLYAEKIVYLPNAVNYFTFEPFPAVAALPALSGRGITFGSFNRLAKVTEESLDLWAKVLLAVPDSRILLKTPELEDPDNQSTILSFFADHGVSANRVVLQGKSSWWEHMQAFNQVDISLDPSPHGGGVTALEGIMMGVPVITLRWPTLTGRLSASILAPLGMSDWIAETPEQYVSIAVSKSSGLTELAILRRQLRNNMNTSLIGNSEAYVREVEQVYRQLWQQWCEPGTTR